MRTIYENNNFRKTNGIYFIKRTTKEPTATEYNAGLISSNIFWLIRSHKLSRVDEQTHTFFVSTTNSIQNSVIRTFWSEDFYGLTT